MSFNDKNTTADELISPSLSAEIPSADENKNATEFTLNVLCHSYDHDKIKDIFIHYILKLLLILQEWILWMPMQ